MNLDIKVKWSLPMVFFDNKAMVKTLDNRIQAGAGIVEREYKKQSPVDKGDLRRGVKAIKKGELSWIVTTEAIDTRGRSYPARLHEGTGRLKGGPDFGYTTGRVRANDIAWGIGGVRPNKFADRTKKNTQQKVFDYVDIGIKDLIKKQKYGLS